VHDVVKKFVVTVSSRDCNIVQNPGYHCRRKHRTLKMLRTCGTVVASSCLLS